MSCQVHEYFVLCFFIFLVFALDSSETGVLSLQGFRAKYLRNILKMSFLFPVLGLQLDFSGCALMVLYFMFFHSLLVRWRITFKFTNHRLDLRLSGLIVAAGETLVLVIAG